MEMELSHDEVLEILELLENSKVEYLELEVGGTRLIANKSGITLNHSLETRHTLEPNPTAKALPPQQSAPKAETPVMAQPAVTAPARTEPEAGLVKVTAPVVGVFYRQSEPGAPPYVEIGSKVEEGTTLGLLEVMKMFTSVTAPLRGEIVEILAQNNEFVEYEQPLILIRPEN
ncbi:MAG: acetyl-CoA carboxylase biotin carboxyl carrier protein [Acidimicrobiaceae bacterium]|nr:acetyl-CoA carboxylase biotin carboxyl carrier protein [Acidimicrobiaceae bacterium]